MELFSEFKIKHLRSGQIRFPTNAQFLGFLLQGFLYLYYRYIRKAHLKSRDTAPKIPWMPLYGAPKVPWKTLLSKIFISAPKVPWRRPLDCEKRKRT